MSFARTRSDAVVKRLDAENYEEHRQRRLQHKSVYLCMYPIILTRIYFFCSEATRYANRLEQKSRAHGSANESEAYITFLVVISQGSWQQDPC